MYTRKGIEKHLNVEDMYDLLGEKTAFRSLVSQVVRGVVNKGNWFAFCTKIDDSQEDIMSIVNSKGVKIGKFLHELYPESSYRGAIYKYMIRDYLCYYEAPTVIKDRENGYGFRNSYNKYLITSNINVVSKWLDISTEDAKMLYGSRVEGVYDDNECDLFPYLKLYETKDGTRKVTKPRKDLDLGIGGTRVIPLFALKEGVDTFYKLASEDTYTVEFFKDGGQLRKINTTFSLKKVREIYNDNNFISRGVEGMYQGDFLKNPSMERGYIRVFEMGASVYDNPLRSINYARIVRFYKETPDITYINIDLEGVLEAFNKGVNNRNLNLVEVRDMLKLFNVGSSLPKEGGTATDFEDWAFGQKMLLSTVFLRSLALFMIGNPQWFNGYTGAPKDYTSEYSEESSSIGDDEFDFLDME